MIPVATRDPREALGGWARSTGYTHREIGALYGVTKDAVRQWASGNVRVPKRVQARLRAEGWLQQPRKTRRPIRHEPLCPPTRPCRSCSNRRWRQRVMVARRWDAWTPEQCARLAELAGTDSLHGIAATLYAEFAIPRTPGAVGDRLTRLGISRQTALVTCQQVAYWCAVDDTSVLAWIARGWLAADQPGGWHTAYMIRPAALEAFLRAQYPMLHRQAMPRSRWRDIVELLWRRDPIYNLAEAARLSGIACATLRTYCRSGELPAERITQRSGGGSSWHVRRSALARFQVRRPSRLQSQRTQESA